MDHRSTTYSIKYHAPWHELKHVWVGRSYGPDFYEPVKNSRVRESLQKIALETEEDYQGLIRTLQSFNIHVQRPGIDSEINILDYVDNDSGKITYSSAGSYTLIPRPPMQPRDHQLIVGESYMSTNSHIHWFKDLQRTLNLPRHLISPQNFDAPLATVLGDTIILDCREHPWLYEYFSIQFPDYKIVPVYIGGHNDAVFCPLKPGLLISTHHHSNYADTLPGWKVKFIENQSWNAIPGWRKIKHSAQRWWAPEKDSCPEFSEFVDSWLHDWLGYVTETVFDVNMLQINEHTVLVNNYNKDLFDFFNQHRVEAIITPFRHRFFWDGGIHCITSDIYREGDCERYVD